MFRHAILIGLGVVTLLAADPPTFNRDVRPIMERNCVGCHRPGQIAPISFTSYETTRPWATQIKQVVAARKMPPAVTSPHYIVFTKDDALTQNEIDIIVRWVDAGAPEGAVERSK
jgi:hypothetical protein